MVNSVDYDQAAPLEKQSNLGLHCSPRPLSEKSDHCGSKISMFYLHAIIIPFQKHTDKMANSVDHDQTAPLIRVHTARPDLCLKNLDHCGNKISMFYLYAIIFPFPTPFFFFKRNNKKGLDFPYLS